MTPIGNLNELSAALAQPRTFLFLWVEWAIQARHSQEVVADFAAVWQAEHPDQPVTCYLVDASSQSGEVWETLTNLLCAEGRPIHSLLWLGGGPLLWMRSGHIVFHVIAAHDFTPAKLLELTDRVFGTNP